MKALETLKEMLEEEVKKITKKGDITPVEVEAMYKVVDIIKDIETIEAMEGYGDDGYSSRYAYDDGWSYRRGRDSMGRYMSRGRYSMADAKNAMMSKLEEAMHEATNEHDRQAIMACMDKM